MSILLSLVLVLGLMPGMSLMAYAANYNLSEPEGWAQLASGKYLYQGDSVSTGYDFALQYGNKTFKETPHNKGGRLASEFSVMRACKFRRLAGGKSRNLQDVNGGKGTARRAARLCGGSLSCVV